MNQIDLFEQEEEENRRLRSLFNEYTEMPMENTISLRNTWEKPQALVEAMWSLQEPVPHPNRRVWRNPNSRAATVPEWSYNQNRNGSQLELLEMNENENENENIENLREGTAPRQELLEMNENDNENIENEMNAPNLELLEMNGNENEYIKRVREENAPRQKLFEMNESDNENIENESNPPNLEILEMNPPNLEILEMNASNQELIEINENVNAYIKSVRESLDGGDMPPRLQNRMYFVLDMEMVLNFKEPLDSRIEYLENLCKLVLPGTEGSMLYIPQIVIKQLYYFNEGQREYSTKVQIADRAIRYLSSKFDTTLEIQAQLATDEDHYLFPVCCIEDSIVNSCLQLQREVPNLMLLTYSSCLQRTAKSMGIQVSSYPVLNDKYPEAFAALQIKRKPLQTMQLDGVGKRKGRALYKRRRYTCKI